MRTKMIKCSSLALTAFSAIALSGCNGPAVNVEIPAKLNLICKPVVEKVIFHDPESDDFKEWEISDTKENGTIHRFKDDKLYLTDPSRPGGEYLYNTVVEVPGLISGYRSSLKIIKFNLNKTRAIITHADGLSTSIYTLKCSKGAEQD